MGVPGYLRLPTEAETLAAVDLFDRAIRQRRTVRVLFFQEAGGWFTDSLDALFGRRKRLRTRPVWRTVEPQRLDTNADGMPYAEVISLTPTGSDRPQTRIIRLDRVAVGMHGLMIVITRERFRVTGTALDPANVPTKGELTGSAR